MGRCNLMSRSKAKRRNKSKKRKHRSTRVPAPNRLLASRQERPLLGSVKRWWQQILAVSGSRSIAAFVKGRWKPVFYVLPALCTIAAFMIVIWWPRLDFRPGEAVSPSDPFDTPFFLRNDGYLSIKDIEFTCVLRDVRFRVPQEGGIENIGLGLPDAKVAKLGPGESHSVEFNRLFAGTRVGQADIEVMLTYSPFLVPIRLEKSQRFKMVRNPANELKWVPVARSK